MAEDSSIYQDEKAIDSDKVQRREELQRRLNNMSEDARNILFQMIQLDTLTEMFDLLKNMTSTSAEEWNRVIKKLKNIKDLKITKKDAIDFSKLIEILLPLIGALVGTLLALNDADKMEAAADEEIEKMNEGLLKKRDEISSIVLSMCDKEENGFSY